jgi:hypothetical protein
MIWTDKDGFVRWLLFEVVVPLFPLCFFPLAAYLFEQPWSWVDILADGSVLLYATTIASKAVGDHLSKLGSDLEKGICVAILIVIVAFSTFIYAFIVMTSRLILASSFSQQRAAVWSAGLALSSLVFSFGLRIVTRGLSLSAGGRLPPS